MKQDKHNANVSIQCLLLMKAFQVIQQVYVSCINPCRSRSNPELSISILLLPVLPTIQLQQLNPQQALKYYFLEFRNKGIFYEAVTNVILDDLIKACDPKYMEIITEWKVRGGMTSIIKAEYKKV